MSGLPPIWKSYLPLVSNPVGLLALSGQRGGIEDLLLHRCLIVVIQLAETLLRDVTLTFIVVYLLCELMTESMSVLSEQNNVENVLGLKTSL
jgi:hypothetical protein